MSFIIISYSYFYFFSNVLWSCRSKNKNNFKKVKFCPVFESVLLYFHQHQFPEQTDQLETCRAFLKTCSQPPNSRRREAHLFHSLAGGQTAASFYFFLLEEEEDHSFTLMSTRSNTKHSSKSAELYLQNPTSFAANPEWTEPDRNMEDS